MCETELPTLEPGEHGVGHLKRCHLRNPEQVLREEKPLITETVEDAALDAHDDEPAEEADDE